MTGSEFDKVAFGYTTNINSTEEENKLLRETITSMKSELRKFRTPPYLICEVRDITDNHAIVSLKNGNEFYVDISDEAKNVKPGDYVLAHQKNLTILGKVNAPNQFNAHQFVIIEKPTVAWDEIGGLDKESREVKEVVELPLKSPELFREIGITPPKGILLHGPPGTGKTLLAKAVASSTNSTFIEIVASELVQKFIGEGAKLVKEIFELARQKAPCIVFIDEVDALAAQRIELGTSGEREVQRTFMQLLAELDGFNPLDNVKVIAATNRRDILDPAVLRPGRLERQIEVGEPNIEGIKQIFGIHTRNLKIAKFKKDDLYKKMEGLTGAGIKAVVTEAGYGAIRDGRKQVAKTDIISAIDKVKSYDMEEQGEIGMFG